MGKSQVWAVMAPSQHALPSGLHPSAFEGSRKGAACRPAYPIAQANAFNVARICAGRRLRKRLTHAPPADIDARPPPRRDFIAPPPLLPGILMAWDFCSTYRRVP